MSATYLLRRHQATMASAAKPEAIAERKINQEVSRLALAECRARFPALTAENFEVADQYRKERVAHWGAALSA